MDTTFETPEGLVPETSLGLSEDGAVRLPFPNMFFYWRNGNPAMKDIAAQPGHATDYFGGWAINAEDYETVCDEFGVNAGLTRISTVNREGNSFDIYTSRNLSVALIKTRERWITNEDNKTQRSQFQALCYMAQYDTVKKLYVPFGPAVLSAKGWAAKRIKQAFKKWDSETAAARKEFTSSKIYKSGIPAWYFYAAIGTIGKEIKTESVGNKQKSNITPCDVYLPINKETGERIPITKEFLHTCYVGSSTFAIMHDLASQSKEWLDAWAEPTKEQDARNLEPEPEPIGADSPLDDFPF